MATTQTKNVQYMGTGRRKEAVARVRIVPGNGTIIVNKKSFDEYFNLDVLRVIIRQPLILTKTESKYNVICNVNGGGYTGQSGAIRHAISRALLKIDEEFKSVLKKAGFLRRDPRTKERKKYGLRKARKRKQYSKR